VEPEVAFVLKHPLAGPDLTVADVLRATDFVLPALEVIDSRIADWRITLPDTVSIMPALPRWWQVSTDAVKHGEFDLD
jgi:2-keto-4-pentenoate hydratase